MCGIFGSIGKEPAAPFLLKGLQNLEYRGYDSAGIATVAEGKIWARKDIGKLAEVQQKHNLGGLPGTVGIGHARWATHGSVTPANAHPHFDCKMEIAVVHNGIIENYQELRHRLEIRHRFVSETDTEVIPHLIEEFTEAGASLKEAILQTIRQLQGPYALLAISAKEPQKIVASRKDSPLAVRRGRGRISLSASAFLQSPG